MSNFNVVALNSELLNDRLDELEDIQECPEHTDSDIDAEVEAIKEVLLERDVSKYQFATIAVMCDGVTDGKELTEKNLSILMYNDFTNDVCPSLAFAFDKKSLASFAFTFDEKSLASSFNGDWKTIEIPVTLQQLGNDPAETIQESIIQLLNVAGFENEEMVAKLRSAIVNQLPLDKKQLEMAVRSVLDVILNM